MNSMFVKCSDELIYKLKALYKNFEDEAFEEEELDFCPGYYIKI